MFSCAYVETMTIILSHLQPDSSYSIHCYGLPILSASVSEVSQPEHTIHTLAGEGMRMFFITSNYKHNRNQIPHIIDLL